MDLTQEEELMLQGAYGPAAKRLISISLKVAEVNGAKGMVDVKSVHNASIHTFREGPGSWGTVGIELLEELAREGLKFKIPYTTNGCTVVPELVGMGLPQEAQDTQQRAVTALRKLQAVPIFSCVPFLEWSSPRLGDHLAWAETGTVTFANSYYGARTNRETDLTCLAAAFTGRTPAYGYHLDENRFGDILVEVDMELDNNDLGALGFYIAKTETGTAIPVFNGISPHIGYEGVSQLLSAQGMLAPIAMVHIVGVTPEAPTLEEAFGGRKPKKTIVVTKKDIEEACQGLSTGDKDTKLDLVLLGCHYATLEKIADVAKALENKHVHKDVHLWIQTSRSIKNMAEHNGYVEKIEAAGARVFADVCCAGVSFKKYSDKLKINSMATDAPKMSYISQSAPYPGPLKTLYGSTERCIEAAIRGTW